MNKIPIFGFSTIIILMLLLGNCDHSPTKVESFQKTISIVGILDNSANPQKIYAFYTTGLNEATEFVPDAVVTVSSNGQHIRFSPVCDSIRRICYYSDRPGTLQVFPEVKYHLTLVTPEGDSLYGETVVPGEFKIIEPMGGTIKTENSLSIRWSRSQSAYGYILNLINPPTEHPPGSGNFIHHQPSCYQTEDTSYTIFREYGFKPGKYTIKVMAYDKNYHYHHAEGISRCGVIGGYGVFASAVIDSVSFDVE